MPENKPNIVERLRDWQDYEPAKTFCAEMLKDVAEAADEIEQLTIVTAPHELTQAIEHFVGSPHISRQYRGDIAVGFEMRRDMPIQLQNGLWFSDKAVAIILGALTADARVHDALQEIDNWSRAYPLKVFPEPDLDRARALLEAGGMTLDAVSASAVRHVVEGVGEIVRGALNRNAT